MVQLNYTDICKFAWDTKTGIKEEQISVFFFNYGLQKWQGYQQNILLSTILIFCVLRVSNKNSNTSTISTIVEQGITRKALSDITDNFPSPSEYKGS